MDYVIIRSPAYYNDDYLAHHGVKGMKWGVRKQKPKRSADEIRKDLELQRKANINYRKSAQVSAITTGAVLAGNAALASIGMLSPALLFAGGVNIGMAAASAGRAVIGDIKVARLEVELENADD